jgi:hypothetical protein
MSKFGSTVKLKNISKQITNKFTFETFFYFFSNCKRFLDFFKPLVRKRTRDSHHFYSIEVCILPWLSRLSIKIKEKQRAEVCNLSLAQLSGLNAWKCTFHGLNKPMGKVPICSFLLIFMSWA